MIFTTVRVERPEGTVVLRDLPVQLDTMGGDTITADSGDARAYELYAVYTTAGVPLVPLRRRDVLYDELGIDPETGQAAKYRVIHVETFDGDHQEAVAERVVGG